MFKLPAWDRIAFLLVLIGAPAIAAADDHWYVGLGGGYTKLTSSDLENGYAQSGSGIGPRAVTSSYLNESHGAWKAFAGWRPWPYVALELGYADYGSQKLGYAGSPVTVGPPASREVQTRDGKRSVTAWGADVVGSWPITEGLDVFASIGIVQARVKLDADYTVHTLFVDQAGSVSDSDRSTAPRYRVGAAFKPWQQWSFRLEYEYLGEVGNEFSHDEFHNVGKSAQETVWLSVARSF